MRIYLGCRISRWLRKNVLSLKVSETTWLLFSFTRAKAVDLIIRAMSVITAVMRVAVYISQSHNLNMSNTLVF